MAWSEKQFLEMLQREVSAAGSQKALADKIHISESFLSEVLRGTRAPGPTILDFYGLEREIRYIEKRKKEK